MPDYGARADGTAKGAGYFGELTRPDGRVSTELSIGVNIAGKEVEIPLLVPGLTHAEIQHLLAGGEPSGQTVDKAVQFALGRLQAGKSPFAEPGEQVAPPSPENPQQAFERGFNAVRGPSEQARGSSPAWWWPGVGGGVRTDDWNRTSGKPKDIFPR